MFWTALAVATVCALGALIGLIALIKPLPRLRLKSRWRAGLVAVVGFAAAVTAANTAMNAMKRSEPILCCVLPPAPVADMKEFDGALGMYEEHDYREALQVFDRLVDKPTGVSLRVAALYGRGLCKRALGDVAGGEKDLAQAATYDPSGSELFERLWVHHKLEAWTPRRTAP